MGSALTAEEEYLVGAVRDGRAVLLLGAGASVESLNKSGQKIKTGRQLAQTVCIEAGLKYSEEDLPDVIQACVGTLISDDRFREIMRREYVGCQPADDLRSLFSYLGRGVYTLNVDDAVERIGRLGDGRMVQPIHGLIDRINSVELATDLQLIHLNGIASRPEHGFIFSRDDYYSKTSKCSKSLVSRTASDYHKSVPIVIGSALNEPILFTELERIKGMMGRTGASFLVVPSDLSDIQKRAYQTKGIHHLKYDLAFFCSVFATAVGANRKRSPNFFWEALGIKDDVLSGLREVIFALPWP